MIRWLTPILGALILFNCILVFLLLRGMEPLPATLETDLAEIQTQIDDAERDMAEYGGLIRAQALLRKQVLQNSYAMLDQKRRATIRGVRLNYSVEGEPYAPASSGELESLKKRLVEQEEIVEEAEAKAERYGGLVGALALSTAMTERLTLAGLRQRLLASEYGIPALSKMEESQPVSPPGEITSDEEAL